MNKLSKEIKKTLVSTLTTNGAKALSSALNAIVTLFGMIGAMRQKSEEEIIAEFDKAWNENQELALKMVFHARNVRGGMGERRTARILYKHLACIAPETIKKNLMYIPAFGRWDDLFVLIDTPCEKDMFKLIKAQFNADMQAVKVFEETGEQAEISLLGKWLKSCNTSSQESRIIARKTMKHFKMREKEYRTSLAKLRDYLKVVESQISAGKWDSVYYAGVSSNAMSNYRNAFWRHDPERFAQYIGLLKQGHTKINSGTLFPYDILEKYGARASRDGLGCSCNGYDTVLEEQWKALPNYIDSDENVLILADTSGSMNGRPLMTSLGLAIYFAERNKGAFKDLFMTFDRCPSFVQINGSSLKEKIESIKRIDVANTNIEKAFDTLLKTAINGSVPAEDMPKALVIISDMQFDRASRNVFYHDLFAEKFAEAGYEMPNIIYWNVNAVNPVFHATSDVKGVQMASGSSPALFKSILDNLGKTPLEAVLEVLNSDMYSMITL